MEAWYSKLNAQVVDLVGDYAGRELFLLEGDSLVLNSTDDKALDFHDGFQLLHAVWNVERFLSSLLHSQCHFHIIFFEEHCDIVSQIAGKEQNRSKYILAREVVFSHLKSRIEAKHPDIEIHQFQSTSSSEFRQYLHKNNAYFAMCHNGALRTEKERSIEDCLLVIQDMLSFGLDVAVVNEIEWRDGKVMTRVLQAGSSSTAVGKHRLRPRKKNTPPRYTAKYTKHMKDLVRIQKANPNWKFTPREQVTLAVLSALMPEKEILMVPLIMLSFLLHLTCLSTLSLTERRIAAQQIPNADAYDSLLDAFCETAAAFLQTEDFRDSFGEYEATDLHDLIDGRVLRSCMCLIRTNQLLSLSSETRARYLILVEALRTLSGVSTQYDEKPDMSLPHTETAKSLCPDHKKNTSLLPFQHSIFDRHLESIHVSVEESKGEETIDHSIQDNTHWHNRKSLDLRRMVKPQQPTTKWRNPARRNQLQMRNMTKYAASLTNGEGNFLNPETIISPQIARKDKAKSTDKKKESAKTAKIITKNQLRTLEKEQSSWRDSWKRKLSEMKGMDPRKQVQVCSTYLDNLDEKRKAYLHPEIRTYILTALIPLYQHPGVTDDIEKVTLMREIWDHVRVLRKSVDQIPQSCHLLLQVICQKLGFPEFPKPTSPLSDRGLLFSFDPTSIKEPRKPLDLQEFQMLHCGPHMDRQTGSKPDHRVGFEPDAWQKEVLDALDADHSVFVVAPTSAGKTFISFYAMSKVLRESDDGVLVYVAPTKALVNQIAAEIHARFRKTYPNPEYTVWAVHTRDIRINNPMQCQILVTVPHLLQIMLLAPTNATTWAPRVKCIIFDEIHSIGHTDDGLVWEQLLLLAPCRIIGLSATVGNPNEFTEWLSSTQMNLGIPLKLIKHNQRYSDLRKFIFNPPKLFQFQGFQRPCQQKSLLGPGSFDGLSFIHPVTSLSRQRQMPEDLSFEPRDCYLLWQSMVKHASGRFLVPEELHPSRALPSFIRRGDIFQWEVGLKKVLSGWMIDSNSPFELVRADLESPSSHPPSSPAGKFEDTIEAEEDDDDTDDTTDEDVDKPIHGAMSKTQLMTKEKLCTSAFPLLVSLHEQNALPVLLFNYERMTCERFAITTLRALEKAENNYKEGSAWKQKVKDYEKYLAIKSRQARAAEKNKKRKPPSNEEQTLDMIDHENHAFDGFDPDKPLEQFSFANPHKFTWTDLLEEIEMMTKHNKVKPILLEALKRGIGVHHAGMNAQYRHCVERLFRGGFLRVVVATGTLALGINMPCSTVVFLGDSVFLTALNFRQAAGRAGRRGFDLLGNVIFHGIPRHKVYQLISSRLPDLSGHFPITTSLVLRLFILLHNSNESPYAVRAIDALLSQPRLFLGGGESKEKVLHHLRFSIEYLRRQRLLGRHGEPIELATSVAHLYYTERSAFAFHALLRSGYFENLCQLYRTNTEKKLRTLTIVLTHLFGRKSLGYRYNEILKNRDEIKSPSTVLLPDIPSEAAHIIRQHNNDILETYIAYVQTFVEQHLPNPESALPLSETSVGGAGNSNLGRLLGGMEANQSRSGFAGLSGHGDDFESVKDLCDTVRSGVFLEQSVIPHIDIYPDEGMAPLNAYLYDFFCHGCLEPLEVANHISRSDSWFLLNDFSLILATIIVALENYLDPDSVQGSMLGTEVGVEDMISISDDESSEKSEMPGKGSASSSIFSKANIPESKATSIVPDTPLPDSWDDDNSDNESSSGQNDSKPRSLDSALDKVEIKSPVVSIEVLQTFRLLKAQFDEKFHAIFA